MSEGVVNERRATRALGDVQMLANYVDVEVELLEYWFAKPILNSGTDSTNRSQSSLGLEIATILYL